MKHQDLYIIDDNELEQIAGLCEELSFAIDRIIKRRRLSRPSLNPDTAVYRFKDLVEKAMLDDDEDALQRLF
jgi:hypothetical protein